MRMRSTTVIRASAQQRRRPLVSSTALSGETACIHAIAELIPCQFLLARHTRTKSSYSPRVTAAVQPWPPTRPLNAPASVLRSQPSDQPGPPLPCHSVPPSQSAFAVRLPARGSVGQVSHSSGMKECPRHAARAICKLSMLLLRTKTRVKRTGDSTISCGLCQHRGTPLG